MVRAFALALVIAACGARSAAPPKGESPGGGSVTLYRDRALITRRVVVDVPPSGLTTATVQVARGVAAEDIVVVGGDGVTVSAVRVDGELPRPSTETAVDPPPAPDAAPSSGPREVAIAVVARHSGPNVLWISYTTSTLTWEAAYTLVTTPARDSVVASGALAIHNASGIPLRDIAVRVVDAELGAEAARNAKQLSAEVFGPTAGGTDKASIVAARELGHVDLVDGDTRVTLLAEGKPREMHSTLVFDPVGPKLDRKAATPETDLLLGASTPSTAVTESLEIPRDDETRGLPGGPARLLERHPDGSMALVAESRLFDAGTREAPTDAITLGTAAGVKGHRERREITIDHDTRRVTEEVLLTIDNTRPRPIEVVLREHLYRGQNWNLPYYSAPAAKEGPQQITLRTRVPARGQATVLYVVVYTQPTQVPSP